ncbi:MAG: hypothetical protein IKD05_02655 [Tidjanibacter sp.]|nr:hypothetical protein [Tidjanibacter sp.]MBR7129158.1 hypothetical protein [Tidjanibacter sp.]
MKKILFVAFLALAAISCGPKEHEIVIPEPDKGATYLLEGVVATEGFEWSESAIIGLYSMTDGVKAVNLACKIKGYVAPVVPGEGEEEGGETPAPAAFYAAAEGEVPANAKRFVTPAMDLVKGENTFMVYYPYNEELFYVNGTIYGLDVADQQYQAVPNVAAECFSLGTAVGTPKVDETFKFTMNPVSALAQVKVTSTEFADYGVKKISLWTEDSEIKLSGLFNVNVAENKFDLQSSSDRVSTAVKNPALLSAVKTQNIYINTLPADLTGKDMWLLVELEGPKGGVTLPIKKAGVKLEAGKTTLIDLSNLSLADNAAGDWYVPTESRMLAGLGYAYGEANTYLIQCKNGKTYTGATYTENADIPSEVKIDIRPRGDYSKVVDPKGATFEWFKKGNQTIPGQGTGAVYVARTAGYDASAVDPTAYEVSYDGEYTVTVKNTGAYAGAPILLMIKDNKVLWAWFFWNISADGTQLEAKKIGDYEFANMLIGQNTTQYETWVANKSGTNPDPIYRFVAYYQWGRYVPSHHWDYYYTVDKGDGTAGNVAVWLTKPVTLAEAIARPVGGIYGPEANDASWCSEAYTDLWGDTSYSFAKAEVGTKSVYDPCPKGWRVPDALAYKYIDENDASISYNTLVGAPRAILEGFDFISAGYINRMSYPGETGAGRLSNMGAGQNGQAKGHAKWGAAWSNIAGPNQAYLLRHQSDASLTDVVGMAFNSANRQVAAPVRCIKDVDNR